MMNCEVRRPGRLVSRKKPVQQIASWSSCCCVVSQSDLLSSYMTSNFYELNSMMINSVVMTLHFYELNSILFNSVQSVISQSCILTLIW
jgi:hypothetical protein